MKIDLEHRQSAHCESGVTSNLLWKASGGKITEPLAFGIGAGLFYAHLPILKFNGGPAIAFRTMPGWIFKRTCRSLGIPVIRKKFSSREKAKEFLDEQLASGQPVGCQVGVYYLSYFPKEYRFHFNGHNLIVYGKDGDNYLISDPIMETSTMLTSYELERVRFAKGPLAPNGQIYYTQFSGEISDDRIRESIKSGIKHNVFNMLNIPGPFAGVSAIAFSGKRIKKWLSKLGIDKAKLYLAQLVRMQEEIGTGGGGFRYIYAAFLQEAYAYLPQPELLEISKMFTRSGDLWREAAIQASAIYKGRLGSQADFDKMGDYLFEIAELEKEAFLALKNIKWKA
ncbi:BtrH N-terminal domain-containing protein [Mucilaginibacter myungsuensis]|uniref:BtrH N-terminal domain-containing protein n=1 Tax=Mucilaginibacter myungsuensis TaxID=649104 RepID=A0A929L0H9_9SPHI|nr:BtrH N-terminal domain-containing protein [Mucilaginibacter myungsuensis]MBE9663338.1 BtrH N-terminal domain-containing protein [Mucilaginibacter myungsuensis]MDN3600073.1 BtrH N-terminal domain-containing protein [Mucilaginibacter myungsuensis]